jgi:hypothetical protein
MRRPQKTLLHRIAVLNLTDGDNLTDGIDTPAFLDVRQSCPAAMQSVLEAASCTRNHSLRSRENISLTKAPGSKKEPIFASQTKRGTPNTLHDVGTALVNI